MKPFKINKSKKFSKIRISVEMKAKKRFAQYPTSLGLPSFSNEKYALATKNSSNPIQIIKATY